MKVGIVFIKEHISGIKEGAKLSFEAGHAARLVKEGYARPENEDSFKEAVKEIPEPEKVKVVEDVKEPEVVKPTKVLMSTGDIKSETKSKKAKK